MRFVWFWTFWHWSKESFQGGALLRSPLQGIGSHWDEWFRNEASPNDLALIEEAGRSQSTQREFLAWLFRHWAREVQLPQSRMVPRFVAGQLAQLPPFDRWTALEKFRAGYGTAAGVSAIVLTEDSQGEPRDIRTVEAVAVPADSTGARLVPEGFQTEATELASARAAARSLLRGKGLLVFIALWMANGQRPYARWFSRVLTSGWIVTAGLIVFLLLGPEPGNQLFACCALLVALWSSLTLVAAGTIAVQAFRAWRAGMVLSKDLEASQVRLRMNGGLRLKGASAGLPFCLNTLLGLYYLRPETASRAWIWRRFFSAMHRESKSWAGTGVVTASGFLLPVALEPKLRACLRHEQIQHILTPRQREANNRVLDELSKSSSRTAKPAPAELFPSTMQVGLAAERPRLRIHGCRHIAQSVMALGRFADRRRILANVFALGVTAVMLLAAPDLRSILLPHRAPAAVLPASPSPYHIWASLDTKHPRYFSAVLESQYWSNRRVEVQPRGGLTPSVRAEIQLHRVIGTTSVDQEEGVVWIERRRRFLTREFLPGERVGRYSIRYLTQLGHE